eukprot:TRINITY_DN55644_c0_g1_i1.p1 TRINITY_DN55644_c0_g1~~TRINITY_DN55644_c0_g1_i1.p1  ORF type:complete len:1402 (+),score=345.49 TRINITY_DN55644_c0_g1_i1:67-4272(+)
MGRRSAAGTAGGHPPRRRHVATAAATVLAAVAPAAAGGPLRACSSKDYRAVYGPCEPDGRRDVSWVRTPEKHAGRCAGPQYLQPGESRSRVRCDCELSEYRPLYGQCEGSARGLVGWEHKGDCAKDTALEEQLPTGRAPCLCTAADVGSEYTDCDPQSRTRMVVFYWKRQCQPGAEDGVSFAKAAGEPLGLTRGGSGDGEFLLLDENNRLREVSPRREAALAFVGHRLVAVADAGGARVELPSEEDSEAGDKVDLAAWENGTAIPSWHTAQLIFKIALPEREQLACGLQCDSGTYLAPPLTRCAFCPSGSYSIRGDVYAAPWTEFPLSSHTHCAAKNDDPCEPWQLRGDYIDSGDQQGSDNVESTLSLWADVRSIPAILHLTYRVESQSMRDGLLVSIDGRDVWWDSGVRRDWRETSLDLTNDGLDCGWGLNMTAPQIWPDGIPLSESNRHLCIWRNVFSPYKAEIHFDPVGDKTIEYEFELANGTGCHQDDFAVGNFHGKVAFIRRGDCFFVKKIKYAQNAGAAAVVVINKPRPDEGNRWVRMAGPSEGLHIPGVFISYPRGKAVLDALEANQRVSARIERQNTELGRVEVRLTYTKDRMFSQGADRAFIKKMIVEGGKAAAESCQRCGPGTYSHGGREHPDGCIPCPADTYAPGYGHEECLPCLAHESAPKGAVKCQREPCDQVEDYMPVFGECVERACTSPDEHPKCTAGGVIPLMPVSWKPEGCNPMANGSVAPPATRTLGCGQGDEGDCMMQGRYRIDAAHCGTCPPGLVPRAQSAEPASGDCAPCPKGAVAVSVLDLMQGFDDLNGIFATAGEGEPLAPSWSTSCRAPAGREAQAGVAEGCERSQGWLFHSVRHSEALPRTYLAAGKSLMHAEGVRLDLVLNLTFPIGGAVRFNYMVEYPGKERDSDFTWSVKEVNVLWTIWDSTEQEYAARSADLMDGTELSFAGEEVLLEQQLPPGNYTVRWTYEKERPTPLDIVFLLTGLAVEGAAGVPGAKCAPCPADIDCSASPPVPCGEGRGHAPEQEGCSDCGAGTVPGAPSTVKGCAAGCGSGAALKLVSAGGEPHQHCMLGSPEALDRCVLRLPLQGGAGSELAEWHLLGLGGRFQAEPSQRDERHSAVHVDLCDFVNAPQFGAPDANDSVCASRHAVREPGAVRVRPSFACLDMPQMNLAFSLGTSIAATARVGAGNVTGLEVRLADGDRCPADPSRRLSAVVSLLCDPAADYLKRATLNPVASDKDPCVYHIARTSPAACPLCTNASFESYSSECVDGRRTRYWRPRGGGRLNCVGGVLMQPSEVEECSRVVEVRFGANAVTIGVTFAVLAVVLLGLTVLMLYRRHTRLFVRYTQLQRQDQDATAWADNGVGIHIDEDSPPRGAAGAAGAAQPAADLSDDLTDD